MVSYQYYGNLNCPTRADLTNLGFPDSSVGKESACNAGDPSLIPGLGRSTGKGIGYPLQYSWASLVAQLVKNLPAMRELLLLLSCFSHVRLFVTPWTIHSMKFSRPEYWSG